MYICHREEERKKKREREKRIYREKEKTSSSKTFFFYFYIFFIPNYFIHTPAHPNIPYYKHTASKTRIIIL